jgi:hypothetical protein
MNSGSSKGIKLVLGLIGLFSLFSLLEGCSNLLIDSETIEKKPATPGQVADIESKIMKSTQYSLSGNYLAAETTIDEAWTALQSISAASRPVSTTRKAELQRSMAHYVHGYTSALSFTPDSTHITSDYLISKTMSDAFLQLAKNKTYAELGYASADNLTGDKMTADLFLAMSTSALNPKSISDINAALVALDDIKTLTPDLDSWNVAVSAGDPEYVQDEARKKSEKYAGWYYQHGLLSYNKYTLLSDTEKTAATGQGLLAATKADFVKYLASNYFAQMDSTLATFQLKLAEAKMDKLCNPITIDMLLAFIAQEQGETTTAVAHIQSALTVVEDGTFNVAGAEFRKQQIYANTEFAAGIIYFKAGSSYYTQAAAHFQNFKTSAFYTMDVKNRLNCMIMEFYTYRTLDNPLIGDPAAVVASALAEPALAAMKNGTTEEQILYYGVYYIAHLQRMTEKNYDQAITYGQEVLDVQYVKDNYTNASLGDLQKSVFSIYSDLGFAYRNRVKTGADRDAWRVNQKADYQVAEGYLNQGRAQVPTTWATMAATLEQRQIYQSIYFASVLNATDLKDWSDAEAYANTLVQKLLSETQTETIKAQLARVYLSQFTIYGAQYDQTGATPKDTQSRTALQNATLLADQNSWNNATDADLELRLAKQSAYADVQLMSAYDEGNHGNPDGELMRVSSYFASKYLTLSFDPDTQYLSDNNQVAAYQARAWAQINKSAYAAALTTVDAAVTKMSSMVIAGDSVRLEYGFNNYIQKTASYNGLSDWGNVITNAQAAINHAYAAAYKNEVSSRGYAIRKNLVLANFDYAQAQMTMNEYMANIPDSGDGHKYRRSNGQLGQTLAYNVLTLITQNTWKTQDIAALQYYVDKLYSGYSVIYDGNAYFLGFFEPRIVGATVDSSSGKAFTPTRLTQDNTAALSWTGN